MGLAMCVVVTLTLTSWRSMEGASVAVGLVNDQGTDQSLVKPRDALARDLVAVFAQESIRRAFQRRAVDEWRNGHHVSSSST